MMSGSSNSAAGVLAEMEQAALATRRRLVEQGLLVSEAELASAMGLRTSELRLAVSENLLFKLELEGVEYYPAFYAHPAFKRDHLEQVSDVLSTMSGWSKWAFFMRRNALLDCLSPLEALELGRLEAVISAAHSYAGR